MSSTAVQDLLALLAISAGPGQERPVAEHLQRTLRESGVDPACFAFDQAQEQSEYGGNCGNLIVRLEGHGRPPRRLFSAHMDTVPTALGAEPRLEEAAGRIVNGAQGKALGGDNRTGCAVLLQVARALCSRRGGHPPTTLIFFIQEEVGLVGARGMDLSKLGAPRPAMGFNFDGGHARELVTSVIGTERFTIEIEGLAAHAGAHPGAGVSAALIAARALAELDRGGWTGVIRKDEGQGSANLGVLNGGSGSNVVMPRLHALAEARAHDPAFRKAIIEAWKGAFTEAARAQRNEAGQAGKVVFGKGPTYEAFALAPDVPVVETVRAAAKRCSLDVECVRNDGGMDANWIVAHGIPTVTLGAGQRQVHTPDEWIDVPEFETACRLAVEIATGEAPEG